MGINVKRQIHQAEKNLRHLKGGRIEAGWFASNVQPGVLSAPALASILEHGARLPGGQPYFVDGNGDLHFLRKTSRLGIKALKSRSSGKNYARPNPAGNRTKSYRAQSREIVGLGVTKPSYIPPRAMLRQTAAQHQNGWVEKSRIIARNVINGHHTVKQGLDQLGSVIAADIKDVMSHGAFAPNSSLTAKRKGKNTPLIDTGALRDQVTFKTETGK